MNERAAQIGLGIVWVISAATAHDIPSDVTAQIWLKQDGQRVSAIVRIPLSAVRDVDFPRFDQDYLDVEALTALLPNLARVWIAEPLELYQSGQRLTPRVVATLISLPSDRSFFDFDSARAHVASAGLKNEAKLVWNQVLFDVLLEYSASSATSELSLRPGMQGLAARVTTVVKYVLPDGAIRPFEFTGDPGLVPLSPSWTAAAARFLELGFQHILDGTDHLLFLFCLVIPFRKLTALVGIVTAFSVGHSLTLIGSALGFAPDGLWFVPLIETLIAASIVWMALENIAGSRSISHRWIMAFGFGLVHGFGFAFAMRESLQFAGSHLLLSLLSFNVGVELGQIAVLLVLVPALGLLFRTVVEERMGTIIASALVAHTGWHWMVSRWEIFRRFPMPSLRAVSLIWVLIGSIAAVSAFSVWQRLRGSRQMQTET